MKFEKHRIRVGKGSDFIMINLLNPDSKTTPSTEAIRAIVLNKRP